MRQRLLAAASVALLLAAPSAAHAWKNGPPDNKVTDSAADCQSPPYSTHDWIADHARALLAEHERAWLDPHRRLYLIGTEAPDYGEIREGCGTPHRGYNDTGGGTFEKFIADVRLPAVNAYDAVVRTGRHTWKGRSPLLPPAEMDDRYHRQGLADPAVMASVGGALNKAVNETAAMLRGFYEMVVRP